MEIVFCIAAALLSGIAAVLCGMAFSSAKSQKNELIRLKNDFQDYQDRTRREITESVSTTIKSVGDTLTASTGENIKTSLAGLEERIKTLEVTNEQKLEAVRLTMTKQLSYLQEDNAKQLEKIRNTVDEKLQKTLEEKMNESYKTISERLEAVYKGLGEMQTLAVGVGDLKKVLSNVKTRGIMGEYQLGAILEEILAPEQYDKNIVVIPGTNKPVEFAVKLPGNEGGCVYLPIDSKFPGDAYRDLQEAYESGESEKIDSAFKVLETRIKMFARDIHDKYIEPPHTTNFGIMFLPFEGLYSEVVNRGLVEVLQHDYSVSIAGPSTMAALLNSLQMGFRTIAIQKRSGEVYKLLGAVRSEFDKFNVILTGTQKKLSGISDDLDKLVGVRTRAISRKLRDVDKLGDEEARSLLEE